MLGPDDLTHSDDIESELQEIRGALFDDKIGVLGPAEAICLRETATVSEAIERMLARRQAGVLIVDGDGRLTGIFTERDPEALTAGDRIAFAVHCMSVAGYRTVPLVSDDRRPIGVVTVNDVIRWLAGLFPEAVLNLPPGDALKHPHRMDAG